MTSDDFGLHGIGAPSAIPSCSGKLQNAERKTSQETKQIDLHQSVSPILLANLQLGPGKLTCPGTGRHRQLAVLLRFGFDGSLLDQAREETETS